MGFNLGFKGLMSRYLCVRTMKTADVKDACYLGRDLNRYLLKRPVGHKPYWLSQTARLFL